MSVAYIGIGSNLGERQKNIETALQKLGTRRGVEIREVSSLIETEPEGDPTMPKFLNAACRIDTSLYPDELLESLKSVEREMGRKRDPSRRTMSSEQHLRMLEKGTVEFGEEPINAPPGLRPVGPEAEEKDQGPSEVNGWESRTIDLDILFYDDIVMKGNSLIIPHPRLHERFFVLGPLSEIAGEFVHPVLKKSITDILAEKKTDCESNQEP